MSYYYASQQKGTGYFYGFPKLLLNRTVVIDPGHGGIYSGGVHYGLREADINLSVALKLHKRLVMFGAKAILTRKQDVNLAPPGSNLNTDLQARVAVDKNLAADIFVSLHVDDVPNINLLGPASYFPEVRSSQLACAIQTSLINESCSY